MTNWKGNLQIKDLLSPEDVSDATAKTLAKTAGGRIDICQLLPIPVRQELVEEFIAVSNQDSFNDAMTSLYDAADEYRVWIA